MIKNRLQTVLLVTFASTVLIAMVSLSPGPARADERKTVETTAAVDVEAVLRQLRLKLPNKSNDEIIQVLRGYAPAGNADISKGLRWFSQRLEAARAQRLRVVGIELSAGIVSYDHEIGKSGGRLLHPQLNVPPELRGVLGKDFFADPVVVLLGNDGIDFVGKLKNLHRLCVSYRIEDDDLIQLRDLSELRWLDLGGIATRNHQLFQELAAFKNYTTICNSAPSEFLATVALRNSESIVERNLQLIRSNLD